MIYFFLEFESKMSEMQLESNTDDVEILNVLDTIKNSFKKSEVLCSKKLIKHVPQRFKEVTNHFFVHTLFHFVISL